MSHLAADEPLWLETVVLEEFQPAQGLAFRSRLPSGSDSRWSPRFTTVFEDGKPLERVSRPAVQRAPGAFAIGKVAFLSPSDRSDPRSSSRVYEARLPGRISSAIATSLVFLFFGLHVAVVLLFLPSLLRHRPSAPALLFVGLALAGFAITRGVADRLPLTAGTDLLGERLDRIRDDKDAFDALFLGSSRVYRQLDPRVFDEVFAERGETMRSFNLGTPGTRMFEVLDTARWVLALRPKRLRLLVVDCSSDPMRVERENLQTARVIRYHGVRNTVIFLRAIAASRDSPAEKLVEAGRHLFPAALQIGNVGRGLGWVASATGERSPFVPARNQGYFSLDEQFRQPDRQRYEALELSKRYQDLHSDLEHYGELVRRLPGRQKRRPKLDELEIALFRTLQEEAGNEGVRVVFLIDPRVLPRHDLVAAFELGAVESLLRFDNPERFPALYEPSNRFDIHHLNERTAQIYTRLVAESLLELEESR